MKLFTGLVLALILSGCFPHLKIMGGQITDSTSQFDNVREVSMMPAWVCKDEEERGGCPIRMGLFYRGNMAENSVILSAGVTFVANIAPGKSLWFNIDGEKVGFESIDLLTDHQELPVVEFASGPFSVKRYEVTRSFLEKLQSARKVIVRLDLGNEYVEGVFTSSREHHAQKSFERFYSQVYQVSGKSAVSF